MQFCFVRPRDGGQQGCAAREQNRGCDGVSRHLRCVSRDRCDLVVPRHEQFELCAASSRATTLLLASSSFLAFLANEAFSKQRTHDLLRRPHDEKRTLGGRPDDGSFLRGRPTASPCRRRRRGKVTNTITQAILKAPQIYTSAERASTLRSSLSYLVALPPLITLIVGNDSVLNFDDTKSRSSSPRYLATVMPFAAASLANAS